MASSCARKFVQRSVSSAKTFLNRIQSSPSVATGPSKLSGLAPATPSPASRVSPRHGSLFSSRQPVELSSGESLMPLHSVTASVLLKSMLSSKVGQWGCLSEGFAVPL
ncbi:Hypothetical predicted protein [Olea europaea subsp. europaea]|uniref:Protein NUCLEAR FUSION DEFECTIVE 6, chloroplastic/mitochondrial-like n=1 Tax=Olea europaea subsp. europaea TaxID=158383 RepID=A0A8S0TB35_OLEEU|nr:Hypothetical predicted protein [Olea europaea subsp. europaea]